MTIHACFRARLDRPWRSGLCRAPRRQALPVPAVGALPVSSALVPDVTDAFIVEETFKTLVAVAFTSYAFRPRGWSLSACLDVRESTIPGAGRGVFATTGIKRGQVLGAYPGVPRTDQEMTAKALVVPTSRYYVFSVRPGVILDPTGQDGLPSAHPVPSRFWWPFDVDCTLAYVNEPSIGLGVGVNVAVEDDTSDTSGLLFVANRDIEAGEELFIDYGVNYDRRGYGE
ncbi:MAG: SET domain-containing protein-lysine N-methyltransferase [bacterium]|jgi:hypothetical protein